MSDFFPQPGQVGYHSVLRDVTNSDDDAPTTGRARPALTPPPGGYVDMRGRVGYADRGRHSFSDALFNSTNARDTGSPFQNFNEFLHAVRSNPYDQRLHVLNAAAGQSEGIGEDGGFAVPTQFSAALLDAIAEQSLFLRLARVFPATSNQLELPHWDTSKSGGARGGLTGAWLEEAGTATTQVAKMSPLNIRLNKVGVWLSVTSELSQDNPAVSSQLINLAASTIAARIDQACISGNGVGKPLGIMTAPGRITASKEASQAADTISAMNCVAMLARLNAGAFSRAVWLAHPTTLPQLYTLMLKVLNVAGDQFVGGAPAYFWFNAQPSGEMSLLGRPLYVSEHASKLGDEGDLILMDPTEYLIVARQGLRVETSLGPGWSTDEVALRVVARVGGQPQPPVPVAIDATNTTSSFITLEAR